MSDHHKSAYAKGNKNYARRSLKSRLNYSDLPELSIEIKYPNHFDVDEKHVIENTYYIDHFIGKGSYREMYFEGIHIGYGDFHLSNRTILDFQSETETIEMHFTIDGSNCTKSNDIEGDITFSRNQHNLFYINHFKGYSEWPKSGNMKVFEVNILPSLFRRYLPDNQSFDTFRDMIINQNNGILSSHNFPITPEMTVIIQKIITCNRKGVFKKMFFEAHVIELLMLQLEQIMDHNSQEFLGFKKRDTEKLYAVKEIITSQIDRPCSLIGLAQQVGTNEFTLKKGFKELFGTTVFGYWNQLKMERAQKMLIEEDMTVAEVSEKIGYKNPQHFSTAFKKRYGFSPKECKKN